MKKILITGGAGFLGSNLTEKLIENNFIISIDNLSSGSIQNVKPYLNRPNFQFIEHDIIQPIDIEFDEIYNMACPASPVLYQKNPIQTIKTSIIGTLNLIEIARKNNAKFLQASTSEIYGDPVEHPQKETYRGNVDTKSIRSCYDEGKRASETILFDYNRIYGVDTKIARIFNTYGKNMLKDDGRVISNFTVQALLNKDITVYGNGFQTRSFCYVDDLIKGLIKLMESNINDAVNLGNNEEHTILDIANIVIKKTNSKSKIVYKNLPCDDPKKRKPDISKAKKLLNWTPETNLEVGLDKTIEYFREILKWKLQY